MSTFACTMMAAIAICLLLLLLLLLLVLLLLLLLLLLLHLGTFCTTQNVKHQFQNNTANLMCVCPRIVDDMRRETN